MTTSSSFYTNDPNLSIFDPTSTTGLAVASGGSGTPGYIYNSNKVDLSPRVGLSYQVHSGTVLRANYGIYYDQPAGQAFFGNIGIPNQGAGGVNNNPAGSQPNESIVLNTPTAAPIWTDNQTTPIFTAAEGQPTGSNVVSIYSVSRNFKTPYAELFGLNIEQSLGSSWLLNIGYASGLDQPPQPRPAGHQPECTGSRPVRTLPKPDPTVHGHGDRNGERKHVQ